ncbi:MAG: hypothetical protein M3P51_04840 [Chloroflexota bacterium]|nr:hypothetical protein [Chloroflexota bacterium]
MDNDIPTEGLRIRYREFGGFSGIAFVALVDTNRLVPEEAREVERLVDQARFFSLPTLPLYEDCAEMTRYDITVEWEGRCHSISMEMSRVPPGLWPLISRLTGRVGPARQALPGCPPGIVLFTGDEAPVPAALGHTRDCPVRYPATGARRAGPQGRAEFRYATWRIYH